MESHSTVHVLCQKISKALFFHDHQLALASTIYYPRPTPKLHTVTANVKALFYRGKRTKFIINKERLLNFLHRIYRNSILTYILGIISGLILSIVFTKL